MNLSSIRTIPWRRHASFRLTDAHADAPEVWHAVADGERAVCGRAFVESRALTPLRLEAPPYDRCADCLVRLYSRWSGS